MEQDLRACPSCGAPAPALAPCPYCSWTPEPTSSAESGVESGQPISNRQTVNHSKIPQDDRAEIDSSAVVSEASGSSDPSSEDAQPASIRQLLDGSESANESQEILDQVPEDMRALLAARLKATGEGEGREFSEHTEASLRNQGYYVEEDARGARIVGTPGAPTPELSPADVVKMAAELDGGVQPKTELPFCEHCDSASPIGSTNCQWCGEPLPQGA